MADNIADPRNPDTGGGTLGQLADRICAGHRAVTDQMRNALRISLDVGAALNAARKQVPHGKWRAWLMANCFMSVRTAQLYAQLDDHRTEIEDALQKMPDLSLRAARKLVGKSETRTEKTKAKLDLVCAWRASTPAERTAALDQISINEFYQAMPLAWRQSMTDRVTRLKPIDGEPFLKASEALRRALSLIKTAASTSDAAHAEHEAIAALRRVNALLTGAGIDEITVIRERRRAA